MNKFLVSLFSSIKNNKIISLITLLYITIVLSQINFGIPDNNHPFAYHMDEWAQSQSIRAVFRHGTPNVSGASHGTIFHYFLSGIYLIPFILFRIVNPFVIKNSLEHIDIQHRLFEILRLNTLLFGILSIITLAKISKNYLKINPIFPVIFFTITPIFLALSNYFKYDIALVFWILFSILFLLRFAKNPIKKNFFLAGIICGASIAVKLSAIPLLFIYPFSYLLFTPKSKRQVSVFMLGISIFTLTFYILGIPDIFFRFGIYKEWFNSNLFTSPGGTENFNFGFPNWEFYLIFQSYPSIFGHVFFTFFAFSIFYLLTFILIKIKKRKLSETRNEILLCAGLFIFIISVIPLKIGAAGNRALVFLPFFALISGLLLERLKNNFYANFKFIFVFILTAGVCFQFLESLSWISTRISLDPRVSSSLWIEKNLPKGTNIGIEDIPIFQYVPDIALKEFYTKQYFPKKSTAYNFYAIDYKTKTFPTVVIISNAGAYTLYQKQNNKKILLSRLKQNGYKSVTEFSPELKYYHVFNRDLDYFINAIMATPLSITVFERK